MEVKKTKVLVGMSGGVDSSVSAALLLEQGYEVIGAFMKNWSGNATDDYVDDFQKTECGWKNERRDAVRVAAKLGIPFVTLDFEKEYRRDVMDYMFGEYEAGRTPNPDVMCNKFIKFDRFIKEADRLGCKFVATGHYARIENENILKGVDPNKDQSYFLWAINKTTIPRILFPVGGMIKSKVREKARELGLNVADKKDSTGICFVGEVAIHKFLNTKIKDDPGDVVTTDGKKVGKHPGLSFYTIGQRRGLNVGGGMPYYVVDKRAKTKELIVSSNFHPSLFAKELTAARTNWFVDFEAPFHCEARIRYRQPLQKCEIVSKNDNFTVVRFEKPQRAITPGQSIVFYDGDKMLGGGEIESSHL